MPFGNSGACPGGTADNSPMFQRWDLSRSRQTKSPKGRQKLDRWQDFVRPFGTRWVLLTGHPALKRWAILTMSLWDKGGEFPKGITARPTAAAATSCHRLSS